MQVKDVHRISTKFFQAGVEVLLKFGRRMNAWFSRIDFRSQGETTIFPVRITSPGFLLAANIETSCVDFIVTFGLEVIEMAYIFAVIGYTGSSRLIRAFEVLDCN